MAPIEAGKRAPAFTLEDQDGVKHSLKDYAGQPVILFFYPKDLTSGCTTEACDFRDRLPKFAKLDAQVLGISILDTRSKKKFADKQSLTYPLLADDAVDEAGKPAPKIAQKYGVWVEKSMYGKKYMGIERTTLIVDPAGKVARVWSKVKVPGHAEEVLDAMKAMD